MNEMHSFLAMHFSFINIWVYMRIKMYLDKYIYLTEIRLFLMILKECVKQGRDFLCYLKKRHA